MPQNIDKYSTAEIREKNTTMNSAPEFVAIQ